MGYTHGRKWTKELVKSEILKLMAELEVKSMPTQKMVKNSTGSEALNVAISRNGGRIKLAKEMGIECKGKETKLGNYFESQVSDRIKESLFMSNKQMKSGYPYDILVRNNIKIDVKVSKITKNNYFSFNLEKKYPTCDIFVCYCINDDKELLKVYIIPSAVLSGMTQLSIGMENSKYDKYLDRWDMFKIYDKFYNDVKEKL